MPDVKPSDHWNRGGFPESCLTADDQSSVAWRHGFVGTFLERDIPNLGPAGIPVSRIETLWRLIAHLNGQTVNYRMMAESIDVSVPTVKSYLALLFECKASRAPKPSPGLHHLIDDINPDHSYIVAPVDQSCPYSEAIKVAPLRNLVTKYS